MSRAAATGGSSRTWGGAGSARRRRRCLGWVVVVLGVMAAQRGGFGAAWADCAEGAAPKVNWHRCLQDDRVLLKVDLRDAMLREASFLRTDLSGSNLTNADAYRAKFVSTRLVGVVFDGARLMDADFSRANLEGASLQGADLRNSRFYDANLSHANLTGARLDRADLRNATLAGAIWTDGVRLCAENSVGQCN